MTPVSASSVARDVGTARPWPGSPALSVRLARLAIARPTTTPLRLASARACWLRLARTAYAPIASRTRRGEAKFGAALAIARTRLSAATVGNAGSEGRR